MIDTRNLSKGMKLFLRKLSKQDRIERNSLPWSRRAAYTKRFSVNVEQAGIMVSYENLN